MKIHILTPVGYNHAPNFWLSLLNFVQYSYANDIQISFRHNRMSNIYYAREKLLQNTLKDLPDYDYILWIDSDAVFTPMDVEKLINADKDVIGGCAKFHNSKSGTLVYNFGKYFTKNWKSLGILMVNQQVTDELPREPFTVDYTGCHFLLMKKGVCEKLSTPAFEPLTWDKLDPELTMGGFMSEDGAFCWKLKQIGYDIWIDPETQVGHVKEMVL